jgi:hypothetical protein
VSFDELDIDFDDMQGDEEKDLRPVLSPLKIRRKRASREERKQVGEALDLSLLRVLPPEITTQLSWQQERWLAARLHLHSDHQACLNVGIGKTTLQRWRTKDFFAAAYEVVTQDLINLQLTLSRLSAVQTQLKEMSWLQHPSLRVQMKAAEMLDKKHIGLAAAEAKRAAGPQVQITNVASSPVEWLKAALEAGLIGDPGSDELDARAIDLPTGAVGLLESGSELRPSGEVREDSGRDDVLDWSVRVVGLAESPAGDDGPGEVPGHLEGAADWALLVGGSGVPSDGKLPSDE